MPVVYDVCGLAKNSPFTTQFTLIKLGQHGPFQQKPHLETALETAETPRSHERWKLDTHEMSPGSYRLEVLVTDAKKHQVSASRGFKINEKQ